MLPLSGDLKLQVVLQEPLEKSLDVVQVNILKMKFYYKSENNLILSKFMNDPYIIKKRHLKLLDMVLKLMWQIVNTQRM